MSKNDMISLRNKNLITIMPNGQEAQLLMARKIHDNIYRISVKYRKGDYDGGCHWWFATIEEGKFEFMCIADYDSLESLAIKITEEANDR